MKTDACQNASNAKIAQTVVRNVLKGPIAATGLAKNVKIKLNVNHVNKDSILIQHSTYVFSNSHALQHCALNVTMIKTYVNNANLGTISTLK